MPPIFQYQPDEWFAGRRVTVMGLGQFGGGLGVVRWLHSLGARVLIADLSSEEKLSSSLAPLASAIADGSIALRLGAHELVDFQQTDLVVANAAVPRPWENRFLNAAREAGVPVTAEICLSVQRLGTNRVVAITGSAGKSTTTAMTVCALRASGRDVRFGGNIGGSLLNPSGTPTISERGWTVLELSSAQLWWLSKASGSAGWSPKIGVLTNIAPNHVDWHGSVAHYIESKAQIRREQTRDDIFISSFGVEGKVDAIRCASESSAGTWWNDGWDAEAPSADSISLSIPGEHQRRNARIALAITLACAKMDGEPARIDLARAALSTFQGLEHRLQSVGTIEGVLCFNDSKATTPEATQFAIASFQDIARIHLIVGGYDKKIDLSSIRDLAPRLAGLYAIGATEEMLAPAPPALRCGTLANAIECAFSRAKSGDILLLSPACASYGQYTNFEERGKQFVQLVLARQTLNHC